MPGYTEDSFEKFKRDLLPEDPDQCFNLLSDRTEEAEKKLLRVHKGKDRLERDKAVRDFALVAMAEECLLGRAKHEPNKEPSWMEEARDMIDDFIELHPEDRIILRESVFYDEDPEVRMRFALRVSSAVVPGGEYSGENGNLAFANGVALGKITLAE